MAKSCIMIPRLKSGEPSPLFNNLKSFFGNREEALHWYTRAKSSEFTKAFPKVKIDENGEPSFEDLLYKCGLIDVQDEGVILENLNSRYQKKSRSYAGLRDAQDEAANFNRFSPFKNKYFATVETSQSKDDTSVKTVIKPIRLATQEEINKTAFNVGLNKRLEKILSSWNIGIGALSKLEEKLNMSGVADLELASTASNGIKEVIRLAKGIKGQQALPEEFAHFAVAAISDNPLKQRALNVLKDRVVLERILGDEYADYSKLYNGNLDLLAEEALGKLVAKTLNDENVFIENKNLFNRYLTSLKNFFGQHETDEIDAAINATMKDVYELTNNIVNNRYQFKTSNIKHKAKLAHLEENVNRDDKILERIIEQELKRLKIYGTKEEFNATQTAFIKDLKDKIALHQSLEGIYSYIKNSLGVLKSLSARLAKVETGENLTPQEKFNTLRNIRNYVSSYGVILTEIQEEMGKARRRQDDRFVSKLKPLLKDNIDLLGELSSDFYVVAKDEFTNFIKPFVGEGLAITLGKDKGKVYTAEELIESMDSDISIFDRFLDSMADSSDPILQIYDQLVKKQKALARLDTIKFQKEIMRKTRELELSGVKDTSFMYERDEDGNLTGYFVQKTWWSKFHKARNAFFEKLNEKYGDNYSYLDATARNAEIRAWYDANTTKDSKGMIVPNSTYDNPAFKDIERNKAMLEYHNYIMDVKSKYDAVLPNANVNKAPQIRRDFVERMVKSKNKGKYFWESMKDSLVRREDETDLFDKTTLMDFEGKEVMRLPIYYTRNLEDMSDLSTDVASSMIAYVSMVNDFDKMNEVIDALEVGKLVLEQRKVTQTSGDKSKVEKFNILGHEIRNVLNKKGDSNRFMQKLNTFMEMQVYGMQIKDEGTFGKSKVDRAKAANFLNKLTSYSTTALSLLTGTANAVQNITMSSIEAASGRYFNRKELLFADKGYTLALPAFLGEIGSRIKTNKLSLFGELFNVNQDYKQHVKDVNFNRKNIASRLINENALFFTTQAGDHYTQNRVAIALAKRMPMLDNGKASNLWDVLEVVPLDKDKPELGAELKVKKGATKTDGTEFNTDDIIAFSNKIRAIENRLYGIYNSEDKNALQQVSLGRLALLYRNWMRPLWLARFGKGKYDFDLGDYTEGHFITMGRFLSQTIKNLKESEFHIMKDFDKLSDIEKANIKKGLREVATYWTLYVMVALMHGLGEDDDKKPWALRLASYTALRLKTDMGALLPSPTMLDEGLKLFTSPFAAISTLKKLRNTINLVNPVSIIHDDVYTKEVKSGMYKGYKEYQKILIDLLPFRRQIVNAFDPSEPARWYR